MNNSEEAHLCDEYDFGGLSSKPLNGMDNDATRHQDNKGDVIPDDGFIVKMMSRLRRKFSAYHIRLV